MEGESPKDEVPPAALKKRKARVPVPEIPEMPHPHVPTTHGGGHGLPIHIPFLEQIKRRNVGRVAILYVVLAYLTLEVFEMFFHLLELPAWTGRVAVAIAVLGFPVALLFAWAYEVTPEGIKPSDEVDPKKSIAKQTGRRLDYAIIAMLVVALTYFVVDKFWLSKRVTSVVAGAAPAAKAALVAAPVPEKSIAVLPFVDMSEKHDQEYFSDGLSEELIDHLSHNADLKVIARTSSFAFKGKNEDMRVIATKLGVANLLEGSVRKAGVELRITAQLIRASDGAHLWSETYKRKFTDIFRVQEEISTTVASALKVTLLGDVAAKIELGGTRNPEAFDAYLRATKAYYEKQNEKEARAAIADYTKALRLDPHYAMAYADRSLAIRFYAAYWAKGPAIRDSLNKAQSDARQAIALAPDLAQGHLALAQVLMASLDFTGSSRAFERALTLAVGNARVFFNYGLFAALMGHTETGLAAVRRAIQLDPLNRWSHSQLGGALILARRYDEAIVAYKDAKALAPNAEDVNAWLGMAYYYSGTFQSARAVCEKLTDEDNKESCLAFVYEKLGRRADAESMLAKYRDRWGDDGAMAYAQIYAEWGDTRYALDWLETAMRFRNANLVYVKTDPGLDSLRKEPRFQAIVEALKFPE